MTTLDTRELIPVDYSTMDINELENLKASIMHSVIQSEIGQQALHRELTAIRLALASRRLHEPLVVPVGEGE